MPHVSLLSACIYQAVCFAATAAANETAATEADTCQLVMQLVLQHTISFPAAPSLFRLSSSFLHKEPFSVAVLLAASLCFALALQKHADQDYDHVVRHAILIDL